MLKKIHRVAKQRDFERVKKYGRSFFLPNIAIKCLKAGQPYSRFGFIVSNKISKKAIERNRIRRQLREIVRERIDQVLSGFDCVIMVRPDIKKDKFKELEQKIENLFQRSGLIKK